MRFWLRLGLIVALLAGTLQPAAAWAEEAQAEVNQTDSASVNVALNKPATASASCNTNTEGPAKAFDGDRYNKWCANPGAGSWLQVKLNGTYLIDRFVLMHAGSGWDQPVKNTLAFRIQTSMDGTSWSTALNVTANADNSSTHAVSSVKARYVKLLIDTPAQTETETAARINEFEIYGVPDPSADKEPPAQPSGLTVTGKSDTEISMNWKPSTDNVGVSGYKVYSQAATQSSIVTVPTTQTSATISGLTPGTSYQFKVTAVDDESNESLPSETLEAVTLPQLANIALNKKVTVSGVCNANEDGSKAVDGNPYTKWCQTSGVNGWMNVALGSQYKLAKFVVKHGGVAEAQSYNSRAFTISVSVDGTAWTHVAAVTDNTSSITTHVVSSVSAKFVKLTIQEPEQSSANTTVRIPEFEVYGYLDPDADHAAPTAPTDVTASNIKSTRANLSWNASKDNQGVTGYSIYNGAALLGSTTETSYQLTGLAPGQSYSLIVRARDAAGNESSDSIPVSFTTGTGQFTVAGTQILDPDGEPFVMKGVNVDGYNWVWNRDVATDSELHLIKNVWKFNTIRVNSKIKPGGFFQDINHLYAIIDKYTAAGIVVQVEAHDFSGSYYTDTTSPSLSDLADFHKKLALKYKDNPYVWFNVMNEPGAISPQYLTMHERVIKAIREEAGATNLIVVDGTNFASDTTANFGEIKEADSGILTYGEQLADYGNVTFSIHMYDSWESGGAVLANGKTRLDDYIDKVHAKGLSLHIGEYGSPYNSTVSSVIDTVRDVAGKRNIGRIAWSWFAGDAYRMANAPSCNGGYCIDRTDGTKPGNLTRQGNLIWNDNHGLDDQIDLAVEDVQLDSTSFAAGDKVRLMALVRNTGDKKTSGKVKVVFTVNGAQTAAVEVDRDVRFKESVPVLSPEMTVGSNGLDIEAAIDQTASSYGTDANGANDKLTVSFDGQPAAGADLLAEEIKLSPDKASYYFGDVVTLSAVIRNAGSEGVSDGKLKGSFYVNGTSVDTVELAASLQQGQTAVIKSTKPITLTEDSVVSFSFADGSRTADRNRTNQKMFRQVALQPADHVNLLLNAGFELGDTNWSNWGNRMMAAEQPHSGTSALKIGTAVGGGGQDLELEPNTTYMLTAWGKHAAVPNGKAEIGVQYRTTAGGAQVKHILTFENEGGYEVRQLTFTTPPTVVEGNAFVWKNSTNTLFYADDLYLTKVSNLVNNAGFETGEYESAWSNYGLGFDNKKVVSEPVRTGANSLKLGTMAGGVKQSIQLDPGTTYVLGAWGRHDKTPQLPSEIGVEYRVSADEPIVQQKISFAGTSGYVYGQIMFTTPEKLEDGVVYASKMSEDGGSFFADDIVLMRVPNLLLNSGFEAGDVNWSNYGNRTMAAENPHAGSKAIKIGTDVGGGQQDLVLEPNTTYVLGVWGQAGGADKPVDTGIQFRPQAGAEQIKHIIRFSNSGEYAYKSIVFTTPDQLTDANVFIWKPAAGYYAYLDDYILTKMPSPVYADEKSGAPSGPSKLSGAVIGSGEPWRTGSGFPAAFDGKTDTYFDAKEADGSFAGLDMGAGNEQSVSQIRFFVTDASWALERAVGGRFQGSNQSADSGYVDLHLIEEAKPGWNEINLQPTKAYRYLRYLAPAGSHGNIAEVEFIGDKGEIIADTEPPTITFIGNAGTYTVDQTVNITCQAVDSISGIAGGGCESIEGPAYQFSIGENVITASVTDGAGNEAVGSTRFIVKITKASLAALINRFVDKADVRSSLTAKLDAIEKKADSKPDDADKRIQPFLKALSAQSGKSITKEQAELLERLVKAWAQNLSD